MFEKKSKRLLLMIMCICMIFTMIIVYSPVRVLAKETNTVFIATNHTPVKKTTIETLSMASNGILIKWKKNTSCKGYYIYRSVNGARYSKVKTIISNAIVSWKDAATKANGSKYQYKIIAYKTVRGTTYKSAYSNVKTIYFLSRPAISSLANGSDRKMIVKWGRNSKSNGYQIQYSTRPDFSSAKTVTVANKATGSKAIGKLIERKTYYVRIRSYKTAGNTKYYSAWSAKKSVKIKATESNPQPNLPKDYGVFLSVDASAMKKLTNYKTVVIDAQYFSKQDIQTLHKTGTTVYTYLNIGSIENFRDYYPEYKDLAIGDYENWEEEQWIDVSNPRWQLFVADLSNSLYEKGVDGFFIDNCDVYYCNPSNEIFSGLNNILRGIKALGKNVVINGGDSYIARYRQLYGSAKDIMSAVNQEEVFSLYDFDNSSCGKNTAEETAYYCEYVEACSSDGMDVYLLEYTDDLNLIAQIKFYCREKGFHYYISDSIELD